MFEAERECGRPCSLRLSETGEKIFVIIFFCLKE